MGHELFPQLKPREVSRYWNHLCDAKSPVALGLPSRDYIPLYIWGDGANYVKDESIICICMGCVLDNRKNSIESRWPLALCREETQYLFQKSLYWGFYEPLTPCNEPR